MLIDNYLARYSLPGHLCVASWRGTQVTIFYPLCRHRRKPFKRHSMQRQRNQAQLQHRFQLQPPPAENTIKVPWVGGREAKSVLYQYPPRPDVFFLLGGNGGDESLMWARHVVLKMYKFNVDVKQVMHGLHFTNSGPTAKWGQKFYPFWYFLFFVDGPGAREATNFKNLVLPEMNVCTHMHIYIYICIYIYVYVYVYIYTCVLHMNIGTRHLGHFGSSFRRLIAQNVPSTLSTCRPRG